MHQAWRAIDVASKCLAHALLAEAHAENRQLPCEILENRKRDSRFFRRAGAGRYDYRVGMKRAHSRDIDHVVTLHRDVGAELAEVLHEVVGERIVVIDHQNFRHLGDPAAAAVSNSRAALSARIIARALLTDS